MRRREILAIIVLLIILALFSLLSAGCTILPRSGPTKSDVYNSSYNQIPIISITPAIAQKSNLIDLYPWISASKLPPVNYESLDIGDKVEVSIWENASEKLYTGSQQGPSNLGPLSISAAGTIDIPYVGKVIALGLTPDRLQNKLISKLKNKIINPQVIVKKVEGSSKKVSIQGVVPKPGVYEITPGRHDLVSFLAEAGGSTVSPQLTAVELERKGKLFKTTLGDIYQNPHKNINLNPHDNIILSELMPTFTSLGATGSQKLIKFPKRELSLIEAIALAEGLNDEMANPSQVFLLRYEKNYILRSLNSTFKSLGRGDMPVIYVLNMRQMQSIFSAQKFKIRNGDLIITTDAPYTNIRKMFYSLSPIIALSRTAF